MNTTTARYSWYERILSNLTGDPLDPLDSNWSAQSLLPDQRNVGTSEEAIICFHQGGATDAWIAIPVGRSEKGRKPIPAPLPLELLTPFLEKWAQLPPGTFDAGEIHEEITLLGESLATSRLCELGNAFGLDPWLWWLVPLGGFRLIGSLIYQLGPPPAQVIRDWEYQFRVKPSPTFYSVVSPSGWIVDLEEMVRSLRHHYGVNSSDGLKNTVSAMKIPIATVAWPFPSGHGKSEQPNTQQKQEGSSETKIETASQDFSAIGAVLASASFKPPKRHASPKIKNTRLWMSASIAALFLVFLALKVATHPTDPTQQTAQSPETEPAATSDPLVENSDSTESITLEASSIDSIQEEERNMPTLDEVDGHSLANTMADMTPMVAPSLSIPPLEESNDHVTDPVGEESSVARNIQEHWDLDTWGTRREVRFGRGVNSKNGQCSAELRLESENIKDIVVNPIEQQSISGSGMCEWRIAKEDEEAELVVRLFSKPAAKWLWMMQVGARTEFGAEPVGIAPREASAILDRLRAHSHWLSESLDGLQAGPQRPRVPGMPDPGTYSRWLRTQQRETERKIRQWTTIAELCDILVASGKLDLDFSIHSADREVLNK